jgi:hypothetical protein
MDSAKGAIMFLVFLSGRSGINNVVGEAAKVAQSSDSEGIRLAKRFNSIADKGLFVMGAISDPSALPDYKPPEKGGREEGRNQIATPRHLVARRRSEQGGNHPGGRREDTVRKSPPRTAHRGPRNHP